MPNFAFSPPSRNIASGERASSKKGYKSGTDKFTDFKLAKIIPVPSARCETCSRSL